MYPICSPLEVNTLTLKQRFWSYFNSLKVQSELQRKIVLLQRNFDLRSRDQVARGLMVSELASGSNGLGSSPGRGHCVVFLGKTLACDLIFVP